MWCRNCALIKTNHVNRALMMLAAETATSSRARSYPSSHDAYSTSRCRQVLCLPQDHLRMMTSIPLDKQGQRDNEHAVALGLRNSEVDRHRSRQEYQQVLKHTDKRTDKRVHFYRFCTVNFYYTLLTTKRILQRLWFFWFRFRFCGGVFYFL